MDRRWLCRHCGLNAKNEIFDSPNKITREEFGKRWVCHSCGSYGWTSDLDSPIKITEEIYDKYWEKIQKDKEFMPENYERV